MNRWARVTAVIGLSIGFLAATNARAQTPTPAPAGGRAQEFEQVAKQLNLTPQQKMQLLPILASEAPKVKAIKSDTSLTKMQKMSQLRALHQQSEPQVKAILTPDQFQQLKEIRRQEVEQAMRRAADR